MTLRNKLAILGNQYVGKSTLIQKLITTNFQFSKTYSMTNGCEVSVKEINIHELNVELYIHDIGGHESVLEYIVNITNHKPTYVFDKSNTDID
jgi:GTPase SAR1 family protein